MYTKLLRLPAILLLSLVVSSACSGQDTAVTALKSLTDPQKLATLKSDRAANDRLLKCVYWLQTAKGEGTSPAAIIDAAQARTGDSPSHATLVKQNLLRNLDIAEKLGCTTEDNLEKMRRGNSPTISKGPYTGEPAEVDHIVPVSLFPEYGNEIANLELMPRTLNRRKSNKMGARQRDYLRR